MKVLNVVLVLRDPPDPKESQELQEVLVPKAKRFFLRVELPAVISVTSFNHVMIVFREILEKVSQDPEEPLVHQDLLDLELVTARYVSTTTPPFSSVLLIC